MLAAKHDRKVSIHAPARGATTLPAGRPLLVAVSIHAPARGATLLFCVTPEPAACFNPRPRTGGDEKAARQPQGESGFNPRPRTGVSWASPLVIPSDAGRSPPLPWLRYAGAAFAGPMHNASCRARPKGFNPRPRTGGRPACADKRQHRVAVSIHAPARGATIWEWRNSPWPLVSIHAPARGATLDIRSGNPHDSRFNPRPRTGGDWRIQEELSPGYGFQSTPPHGGRPPVVLVPLVAFYVSIHAPARGATDWQRCVKTYDSGFNPRPRTGGDLPLCQGHRHRRSVSIHAPARGATPRYSQTFDSSRCFNPRPRTGGDRDITIKRVAGRRFWFQSTPPHGGVLGFALGYPLRRRAVASAPLASLRGARMRGPYAQCWPPSTTARFQSTPPHGGRQRCPQVVHCLSLFQSTPPHGGRQARF